ncbi:uncharacterized protein LOC142162976 [Nicotiana tabacum]|uniref:Uncharacterized protein LOC142162976 n=1 Tax=Nicotiana tabacum TaxID=4097 RepID=A0AC58RUF4_TOBAC
MWLKVLGFGDKVKEWWTSYGVSGTPSFHLSKKLKWLKGDIIRWNNERGEGARELDESEKERLGEVKREIVELAIAQETSWRQKSRALWLKEGDLNTKFFHRVAVANRRRNFIESLVVDGVRIEGEEEVKGAIVGFYENLYKEEVSWRLTLGGIEFKHIGEGDSEWLERAFEEEEVHEAVSSCAGDKAPRP